MIIASYFRYSATPQITINLTIINGLLVFLLLFKGFKLNKVLCTKEQYFKENKKKKIISEFHSECLVLSWTHYHYRTLDITLIFLHQDLIWEGFMFSRSSGVIWDGLN